jgi:hypothetical protein
VQPGSENTLGLTQSLTLPIEIVDFDPVGHTASARPSNSGNNTGYSPRFLDPSTLLVGGAAPIERYTITSSGLDPLNIAGLPSILAPSGPFKLDNGIAFTSNGAVADVTVQPARQLGTFPLGGSNSQPSIAPEPTLGRVFFLARYDGTTYSSVAPSGIAGFDFNSFLPTAFLPLNIAATDGAPTTTAMDLIRWGQDGLAALTSTGTIYLIRGPAVVPQLLQTSAPPVLDVNVSGSLQHGSGNAVLTLSGTNFLPGVAATWNGAYRTTTLLDATHITVDIPATDLVSPGTASIVAANPGSATSKTVTVIIN